MGRDSPLFDLRDNMITFMTENVVNIGIDKKMACRFMGCKEPLSEALGELYEECLELYMQSADLKAVIRETAVSFEGDDITVFDFGTVKSESLRKNLEGCKKAFVFAATAGGEIDRTMKRLSLSSEAESMVYSCIASSGVECWCDYINERLGEKYSLKPRFSPGYGGVSLEIQKNIFDFLDVRRKIGVSLTDSLMMVPVKSVTAIIGIIESDIDCPQMTSSK